MTDIQNINDPKVLGHINIPYGNYGEYTKEVPFIDEYKTHFLCIVDGSPKAISKKTGLVLQEHRLNAHLPVFSIETWKMWVDWVNDLDPNIENTDFKTALKGFAPLGKSSDFF